MFNYVRSTLLTKPTWFIPKYNSHFSDPYDLAFWNAHNFLAQLKVPEIF